MLSVQVHCFASAFALRPFRLALRLQLGFGLFDFRLPSNNTLPPLTLLRARVS
jgi:hypothetical protein